MSRLESFWTRWFRGRDPLEPPRARRPGWRRRAGASPSDAPARDVASLVRDFPRALRAGELHLVYQPKLQLRSGNIESVEALLRWDHERLGSLAPGEIVPALERSEHLHRLSRWVLRRAMRDQLELTAAGHAITVFVNVSGRMLKDDAFVDELCDHAATAPGAIGIEITETAIIENPQDAIANLRRLVRLGVQVAIDDYGSGLSSLLYLKELPACELKIDRNFISGMTSSHRDPLIVRSTIDLAHALEMKVVAEGVESPAVLALLRVMGCDYAQGYFVSPPLRADSLDRFLAAGEYRAKVDTAAISIRPPEGFWTRTQIAPSGDAKAARSG